MLAVSGGSDDPASLVRMRRRVCKRVPHLCARLQRLLRLAAIAAEGPDPEAALPQLEAAKRSLRKFLRSV